MEGEIPDSFDPINEVPRTLDGMLSELIDLGHDMLAMSRLLVDSAKVGVPDPLVHTVLKMASLVSLQTMTIAKLIEELKKEGA